MRDDGRYIEQGRIKRFRGPWLHARVGPPYRIFFLWLTNEDSIVRKSPNRSPRGLEGAAAPPKNVQGYGMFSPISRVFRHFQSKQAIFFSFSLIMLLCTHTPLEEYPDCLRARFYSTCSRWMMKNNIYMMSLFHI